EHEITHDGDVVVPPDRRLARRAPRARRHNGHPGRQPRDAHVEEAADHQAEDPDGDDEFWRHLMVVGSGKSDDIGEIVTAWCAASYSNGTPVGSGGAGG